VKNEKMMKKIVGSSGTSIAAEFSAHEKGSMKK
jgi:hypothetical protein